MIQKSTWLHLRIPFSFYLVPVFVFACAIVRPENMATTVLVFFVLHFLLYPASNGFNSYFDKDEGSIGGLQHPPAVSRQLYYVSLLLDVLALGLGFFCGGWFVGMLFLYGMASKAYSHPATRWKNRPYLGWLVAGFFQGYFTFMMVVVGLNGAIPENILDPKLQLPAVLASALLWGSYPMTQVYQHEEDSRRGDETLSRVLGKLGTFHFTAACFLVASSGFFWYFISYYSLLAAIVFLVAMAPVLVFFLWWYLQVRQAEEQANFVNTMRLNQVSALCLNLFFTWLWWLG